MLPTLSFHELEFQGGGVQMQLLGDCDKKVSRLLTHAALAGAGHGPAMSLADESSSRPQAIAFAAAPVTVCTPGDLR
ncbi:hypothetical protein AV530_000047 [Patagioenas fasciata monilis]|uniref:Uncharacterized protein n=1 Tax=Patagioenas fasciata monilis TaxID=372326 RepID=A0A1V4K004_PATFA|nr:hypothetical protein AV530_000047 [Patagioenas fasciata monilis]